jgi:hypothetical protein
MGEQHVNQDEVDARFQIVKERYGGVMDPNDFGAVRGRVEAIVKASSELRAVKLENGDEPFSVFAPFGGDEQGLE